MSKWHLPNALLTHTGYLAALLLAVNVADLIAVWAFALPKFLSPDRILGPGYVGEPWHRAAHVTELTAATILTGLGIATIAMVAISLMFDLAQVLFPNLKWPHK